MLRALPLALASLMVAQSPDDMVLCTTASDCPSGAACEDGVCVVSEREVAPEQPPPKKKRVRRRRRRERDPNRCRRGDCELGQECFKGACGPPVPSKGTGFLVAGGIVSGVSLVFFASSALCQLDEDNSQRDQNVCTAINASIGAVALGVGIPLLVIGVLRRTEFQEWVRTYHPQLALVPKEDGAVASLGFSF
jgi:hypothetical protein